MTHARGFIFVEYGQLLPSERSVGTSLFYALTRLGEEPVICFFVLSGFLVGGRAIERIVSERFVLTDYLVDRCSRIFPPLVAAQLLTTLVAMYAGIPVNFLHFLGNLLSLQPVVVPPYAGNAPLWSLAYEVWFYVLVGVVAVIAQQRHHLRLAIAILLLATVLSLLAPVYLFCWLIGSVAYLMLRTVRVSIGYVCVAGVFLLMSIAALQLGAGGSMSARLLQGAEQGAAVLKALSQLVLAGCVAYLFIAVVRLTPRTRVTLVLERLGTYCAGFSFSLYLMHYPLLNLLSHLGVGKYNVLSSTSIGIYVLAVTACCAVAWLISLFVERNVYAIRMAVHRRFDRSVGV